MTTINKLQAICKAKMCIVKFTTLKYVYSVCGVIHLKNLAQSPNTSSEYKQN